MEHDVFKQFPIPGELVKVEACQTGHINGTRIATYEQNGRQVRYVHQKINQNVFPDPPALMRNMARVTEHLRRKLEQTIGDASNRCLTLISTRSGEFFAQDDTGEYWRTFLFLEGLKSYDAVETPRQAFEAGRAFGEFQRDLIDLPGERLTEVIPHFHNSRKRFNALMAAVQKDAFNRAQSARSEIEFALMHEMMVDVIVNALAKKTIPERITHNDTKFNNVMLDPVTGEARCVIDLDTVMPGCVLYDFGDMVRTVTSPSLEDERDLSRVGLQMPLFEKLAEGYLSATSGFLTQSEKSRIAFSGKLITLTIGLRFLTDYLSGDTYFKTHRPGHNLDRCRTQFKLVESIEAQEDTMQAYVNRL